MLVELQGIPNGDKWAFKCAFCNRFYTLRRPTLSHHCLSAPGQACPFKESPCKHLGNPTGELVTGCGCDVPDAWKVIYACDLHSICVPHKLHKGPAARFHACQGCQEREARP